MELTDNDYGIIYDIIIKQTEHRSYFEVDYFKDDYLLNVCGEVKKRYICSLGDGITTPKEKIIKIDIDIEFWECRLNDRLVNCNFNPEKL